jgi:hypothetical protein
MIDIEEAAARAIAAPVGPPPEMAHVEKLAGRNRRRRAVVRATTAVAAVTVATAIGVTVISQGGGDGVKVVTTSPSTVSPSTTVAPAPETLDELVSRLKVDHDVTVDGTANGTPLAPVAHLLCVDRTRVHVYEYSDDAARVAVSDTISADGSELRSPPDSNGNSNHTIVDWIASPHFFAHGRIIVLMLGENAELMTWMTDVLGPTLSPQAFAGRTAIVCGVPATTSTAAR